MAVFTFAQAAGQALHLGLSTDTKPTPENGHTFFSTDSGQLLTGNGSIWVPSQKHVNVLSLSDFPTPVSSVITLADNTVYIINGTVDIGTNRIVVGIKNTIVGVDRQNDILQSSTTGTMFTMDNSITPKLTLIFDNLTLKATAGTLINASGGTTDQVTFISTTISSTPTGGTFSGIVFSMRTSSLTSFSVNGFVFSGVNTALTFRDSSATNNVGTVFDCTSATFSQVRISRNSITASAGNTFLNATGTTITTAAQIALCIFSGTSSHLVNASGVTTPWVFTANQGVANTPVAGLPGPPGQDGADGEDGPSGPPGAQGATGSQGAAGNAGPQGSTGPAVFLEAETGEDGMMGPPGSMGPSGTVGTTGAQGPAGPAVYLEADAGPDGEPGPPGRDGTAGASGTTGSQGPIGPPVFLEADAGEDGQPGSPGVNGLMGLPGQTGAQGPTGPPIFLVGESGEDGESGRPGVTGANGATGAQGPMGPTAHLLADESDDISFPMPVSVNYNPGTVVTPAVPASTVAVRNSTGRAVTVYVKAGTLTVINVGGTVTGIAAAAAANMAHSIPLAPNQTIAITYSVAPTWVWVGGL